MTWPILRNDRVGYIGPFRLFELNNPSCSFPLFSGSVAQQLEYRTIHFAGFPFYFSSSITNLSLVEEKGIQPRDGSYWFDIILLTLSLYLFLVLMHDFCFVCIVIFFSSHCHCSFVTRSCFPGGRLVQCRTV